MQHRSDIAPSEQGPSRSESPKPESLSPVAGASSSALSEAPEPGLRAISSQPGQPPRWSKEAIIERLRYMAKPPRKLRFTRMGRWYLAFTLLLGVAAINTGNNLLFLILGLLLAGIVLSGVLSESTLRELSVERFLPAEPVAGKPVLVGLRIHNAKGKMASYAVMAHDIADGDHWHTNRVEARKGGGGHQTSTELRDLQASADRRSSGQNLQILQETRSEKAEKTKANEAQAEASPQPPSRSRRKGEVGMVFALKIDANSQRDLAYTWVPAKRGRVQLLRVELSTRFPFGLFEKSREFDLPGEVVVLPRDIPAPALVPRRSQILGERPSNKAGHGSEYFALRDARPGDDSRSIHWRSTARRGRPVVVEREHERRRQIAIRLDNRLLSASEEEGVGKGLGGEIREGNSEQSRANGGRVERENPQKNGETGSFENLLKLSSGRSISRKKEKAAKLEAASTALDEAVEIAAALARRARKEGSEIALSTSDVWIPIGGGAGAERRVLRALALLEPLEGGPAPRRVPGADLVDVPVKLGVSAEISPPDASGQSSAAPLSGWASKGARVSKGSRDSKGARDSTGSMDSTGSRGTRSSSAPKGSGDSDLRAPGSSSDSRGSNPRTSPSPKTPTPAEIASRKSKGREPA